MTTSTRTALILLALKTLSASVSALRFEELLTREGQTTATCDRSFVWANNALGRSPCRVAAEVIAPCHGGTFEVRALPNSISKYDQPKDNEANRCACSWAAYNLVSACTACQNIPQGIRLWADYIQFCDASALSDDTFYFRDAVSGLADDVSIPAWATIDPKSWNGQTWNTAQARSISNEGRPDVTKQSVLSTPVQQNSSPPAGAIAGGVIGGLVIIGLAIFLAIFLLRRHRAKLAVAKGIVPPDPYGHLRSPSDATDKSGFTASGYPSFISSSPSPGPPMGHVPHMATGNTVYTTNTNGYPFSVFGTPASATVPAAYVGAGAGPSSPPQHSRNTSVSNIRDDSMITPFTLHRPSDTSTPRKGSVNVPTYDSPNAPPVMRGEDMDLDGTPRRNRVNPPAYSPSPPPASSVHGRPGHNANPSVDTQTSYSGGQGRIMGHSANNSMSDIYTSTPAMDAMSGVPEGTTISRSEPPSSWPRDVKRRPTDDVA